MTYQITVQSRRHTTSFRVDVLRLIAHLCGLFGAFFLLFSAGASDAGRLSLGELLLRITLGAALLLLWRALCFFANELDRRSRRPPHKSTR